MFPLVVTLLSFSSRDSLSSALCVASEPDTVFQILTSILLYLLICPLSVSHMCSLASHAQLSFAAFSFLGITSHTLELLYLVSSRFFDPSDLRLGLTTTSLDFQKSAFLKT